MVAPSLLKKPRASYGSGGSRITLVHLHTLPSVVQACVASGSEPMLDAHSSQLLWFNCARHEVGAVSFVVPWVVMTCRKVMSALNVRVPLCVMPDWSSMAPGQSVPKV